MEEKGFFESLKGFLSGIIVRWILKIGGAWLATIGIESSTVEEIVGGLVAILIGFAISLIQHKKAIKTPTQ